MGPAPALRARGLPAPMVRGTALSGRQLRSSRPHRHRPGPALSSSLAQPGSAFGQEPGAPAHLACPRANSAPQRRLSRSHAADQLRRDESGGEWPGPTPRHRAGCSVSRPLPAARWQLADRYQPGDVADDSLSERVEPAVRPEVVSWAGARRPLPPRPVGRGEGWGEGKPWRVDGPPLPGPLLPPREERKKPPTTSGCTGTRRLAPPGINSRAIKCKKG